MHRTASVEAVRLASAQLREGGANAAEKASLSAHDACKCQSEMQHACWWRRLTSGILQTCVPEDLFVSDTPAESVEPDQVPVESVPAEDMFADGADPMEMALLDDIFGAYAREMGVDVEESGTSQAQVKRKATEEGKQPQKRKNSSKAAKKVF
ncbi:unnamed protein product [Effrenium voratum]|uniref:Uncharacterized protein n=1 Tax=Effrenium voratum TaxID=2562239 RepID=A0AA36N6H8_9DINO|nr:unnamed protein product [Effrenium voratum]